MDNVIDFNTYREQAKPEDIQTSGSDDLVNALRGLIQQLRDSVFHSPPERSTTAS